MVVVPLLPRSVTRVTAARAGALASSRPPSVSVARKMELCIARSSHGQPRPSIRRDGRKRPISVLAPSLLGRHPGRHGATGGHPGLRRRAAARRGGALRGVRRSQPGPGRPRAGPPSVQRAVRRAARGARRVASVCTGTFVLAAAGLLDGRRATTHWAHCGLLDDTYADVTVDPDAIYVHDGNVWTSAGVTAGIDLTLALVADDHGHQAAATIARQLVV